MDRKTRESATTEEAPSDSRPAPKPRRGHPGAPQAPAPAQAAPGAGGDSAGAWDTSPGLQDALGVEAEDAPTTEAAETDAAPSTGGNTAPAPAANRPAAAGHAAVQPKATPSATERELLRAIDGWGTDEALIYRAVERAPVDQIMAVATNPGLVRKVDRDLGGGELHRWRGTLARRVYRDGGDAHLAFFWCVGDDGARKARLRWIGDVQIQRAMLDEVVLHDGNVDVVRQAFESYWLVNVDEDKDSDRPELPTWGLHELAHIHRELKLLPARDVRGVWKRLTLAHRDKKEDGTTPPHSGASMDAAGQFKFGDGVKTASTANYGVGTYLAKEAQKGDAEITVKDTAVLPANAHAKIGLVPVEFAGVDAEASKFQLVAPLGRGFRKGAWVTPRDASAMREVNWLEAVVRHEIGHAVDTALNGRVKDFTERCGGWWSGDSFEHWASKMGDPWKTNDRSTISEEDRAAIRAHILSIKGTLAKAELNAGLDKKHAINRYWDKGVPVIEASKHPARAAKEFYDDPTQVKSYENRRFSINRYYGKFQFHNEQVASARVRSYQMFAPAEFFAEMYAVYYEDVGDVADSELGSKVPVAEWREWITANVHRRGLSPSAAGAGKGGKSPAEADGADDAAPSLPSAAVGAAAGKSGE